MKLIVAFTVLVPTLAAAQQRPLTPDGRPDFQGVYRYDTMTPVERPPEFVDRAALTQAEAESFARRRRAELARAPSAYDEAWLERPDQLTTVDGRRLTSRVTDPPDGRIPSLLPAAQQRLAADAARRRLSPADDPESRSLPERCLTPAPIVEPGGEANLLEIVQTADHLVLHTELMNVVRIIPIARIVTHPMGWRTRGGHSVGRWESETFIVDTVGFTGEFGFTFAAADEHLHVVERLRRIDRDTLLYEATIDDPTVYVRPWTLTQTFRRTTDAMFEFACHEGNHALLNILRGARDEDRRGARP